MIDVIIVDDQEIVREGLKMILGLNNEFNVIGEASNGAELLTLLEHQSPNVILMDIRMPVMDGIEATRLVKENYPDLKVIILTTFNEDEFIFDVLKNGADGYVLKDAGSKEIFNSIKAACEGSVLLNPQVTLKLVNALNTLDKKKPLQEKNLLHLLTPREMDVANHVLKGKSNRAIAEALFLTEGTIKNYVSKILEKLELSNRSELILYLQNYL
ncbi:LuxR family transcriptional regulator [Clostridium acetobutylicum]|nr:LuxR family transcriptional regulator [Clostridium acetobutylicum]